MSVVVKLIKQSDTSNGHLRNLQDYILKPEANQEARMDSWYFNPVSDDSARAEMLALNEVNGHARSTFKHLLISFSPEVFPNRTQAHEASSILLCEMGLDKCVSMVGMHYDKDHVHLHVAVVTINPDTFRSVHAEWLIEAMHRAAAKINYVQGWKPQDNQVYSVIDDGNTKIALRNRDKGRALPANELGAFHSQKTAAEVTAEDVAKILKSTSVKTWDDFHKNLAHFGIEYQKKERGAVFVINQDNKKVPVKASVISRATTLSELVKYFGQFQQSLYAPSPRKIEPVDGMGNDVNAVWQKFKRTKEGLVKFKIAISQTRKKEFDNLKNAQTLERKELATIGWVGKGNLFNLEKMKLAVKHAQEQSRFKKTFLERKNKKIQEVYDKHGSTTRFDEYLKFHDPSLFEHHKDQQRKFKQTNKTYFGAVEVQADPLFKKPKGIESYGFTNVTMLDKSQSSVIKFTNQDGRVDFIDEGKRISVIHVGQDSVCALLQLSSQKWKSFELTGSMEFKRMCAEEAQKLGIHKKITNSDVQKMITDIQQSEFYKKSGSTPPKPNLPKWNKPIKAKVNVLKEIIQLPIVEPESRQQLIINAYLAHANDLANKPKNDYFRDMEIAIQLQAVGYKDEEIVNTINHVSPLVQSGDVHSRYTKHLIAAINKPSVCDEWKDIVAKNQDVWIQLGELAPKSPAF